MSDDSKDDDIIALAVKLRKAGVHHMVLELSLDTPDGPRSKRIGFSAEGDIVSDGQIEDEPKSRRRR